MKTFLHLAAGLALLCVSLTAKAQYTENFTATTIGNVPPGWTVASNTDVAVNQRPGTCGVTDKGLLTPGVGKNAPMGFVLPATTYNASSNNIIVTFSVFVYDANLRCGAAKPFPCPTYVKAYIVPTSWNKPTGTPKATEYYMAQEDYQILYPNASNTIVFSNAALPAGVTSYRVLLNFKTAPNSNCTSGGTKFVFDDFGINAAACTDCAPTANADYFNADVQSLFSSSPSFNANVYGGYARWANEAPAGFATASLTFTPAANSGADYDLNNSSLSNARFALASPLTVESGVGCTGTASAGTLTFNSNGTFTYAKGSACVRRVSFTYTLTTYTGAGNGQAFGTTNATKVTIDLPGQLVNLPVHFNSFSATRKDKQVLLKWETAMEQNNRGFYVQRNTGNGWKDIGLVFSQTEDGNSTAALSYAFTDLNLIESIAQYRLLQVDFDGKGRYSETRAVHGKATGSNLTVFPNPSTTGAVSLLFGSAGSKQVTVADGAGRVLKQYKNISGSSLEVNNLQDGFYTIAVHDGITGATSVEKLIVKKR